MSHFVYNKRPRYLSLRKIALIILVASSAAEQKGNDISGMKDFGNRLEGTSVRLDALEDLALLSVEGYVEPFSRLRKNPS